MRDILFTYIVPTKLRFPGLEQHLSNVCDSQYIDRVVVLNSSDKNYRPTEPNKLLHKHREKILVVNSSRGSSFKNPAWNIGMHYARIQSHHIILASEFLEFDASVINLIAEQINDIDNLGVIGLHDEIIGDYSEVNYIYTQETNECNSSFGTLMFLEKKKYVPITGAKHLYGDKILFDKLKEKGYQNLLLRSDTFRIKDNSMELSLEEKLQVSLDTQYWNSLTKGLIY